MCSRFLGVRGIPERGQRPPGQPCSPSRGDPPSHRVAPSARNYPARSARPSRSCSRIAIPALFSARCQGSEASPIAWANCGVVIPSGWHAKACSNVRVRPVCVMWVHRF